MHTLRLTRGDLTVYAGGYEMVNGPAKIVQDLRCALLEPLGNDRFHPGYGSVLDDYIGGLSDARTMFAVQQEVARVVRNYVAVQQDQIARDAISGGKSRFHTGEVISRVDGIEISPHEDRLYVTIRLTTSSRETVVLQTSV